MPCRSFLNFAVSALLALMALAALLACQQSALAGKEDGKAIDGQKIFASHCAECHPGGGNVRNPQKPVKGSKHLAALATFKAYLENPRGHMPYYAHISQNEEWLSALYAYVKALK